VTSPRPYPDYDNKPLEVVGESMWEVYDPWTAQLLGYFYQEDDAKLFAKAYMKKHKKEAT
jgi:hypothetical protein